MAIKTPLHYQFLEILQKHASLLSTFTPVYILTYHQPTILIF